MNKYSKVIALVDNPLIRNAWLRQTIAGLALLALLAHTSNAQTLPLDITPNGEVIASQPVLPQPPNSEQDHAKLLTMLAIKTLRRGADGDPSSAHAANYSEPLANTHLKSLPPLLTTTSGKTIGTAQQWSEQAVPELKALFAELIYGQLPASLPPIHWSHTMSPQPKTISSVAKGSISTSTTTIVAEVRHPSYRELDVNFNARLVIPTDRKGPVPVVIALQFDPKMFERFREFMPPEKLAEILAESERWKQQLLAKGWGYAELIPTDFQADNGEGLYRGLIGYANNGQPRQPAQWGTLRAWGWGASQLRNYIEALPEVAAGKVMIYGHSRFGKAALVAMAFDPEFAAAFISSSGEGGAKLWRRNFGEQIGNIAGSGEYHWMAGNFVRYAGPLGVDDLPVDAHQLIALCAPRPVFISAGDVGDAWVDPKGMYLAAQYASPAYELFGVKALTNTEFPLVDQGLTTTVLSYRQHSGGHTSAPNWPSFLTFAERFLRLTH